jgi:hypothetical protein
VLTNTGLAKFREAAPIYLEGIQQEFAAEISDRELRTVLDVLTRVRDRARGER